MMETNKNYQQQQINGKDQTVILDSSLTAETDEMDASFITSEPPVDPEDKDDEEDSSKAYTDDEFPTREDLGEEEDDPGLNHDENDDLSLNINEDDELY
jgi:hypothetical protein